MAGFFALIKPPLTRADFPVSGENVRVADKRGAGPAGLAFAEQKTEGENLSPSQESEIPDSSSSGGKRKPLVLRGEKGESHVTKNARQRVAEATAPT